MEIKYGSDIKSPLYSLNCVIEYKGIESYMTIDI